VTALAPPGRTGAYTGLYGLCQVAGQSSGPLIGQAALQPSPALALPSSHSSPAIFRPSPQRPRCWLRCRPALPGSRWGCSGSPPAWDIGN